MSAPSLRLLLAGPAVLLLAACMGPAAGVPSATHPTPPSPHPTSTPNPAASPAPATPGTPTPTAPAAISCDGTLAGSIREDLARGELAYSYRANGTQRFPGGHIDIAYAYEGARHGAWRWWRRILAGPGFHDEAVGNADSTWLRWPFERQWELDTDHEAQLTDPLAQMLRHDGWQAQPVAEGCLLTTSTQSRETEIAYALVVDAAGRPIAANEQGRRPDAPQGEGVPAAWQLSFTFSAALPDHLPAVPPATLGADDTTVQAMLAVNDAADARVLWRATAGEVEVVAFTAPVAHGFIAWAKDGHLLEAAVLDHGQLAANLLELNLPGKLEADHDDRPYAVAVVLDERVASLELQTEGGSRREVALRAPGRLIELDGYLDGWRFRFSDGSWVPRPR